MILNTDGKEKLLAEVYRLLEVVGIRVEDEEVKERMLAIGCTEKPKSRIAVPQTLVADMAEHQKKTQAEDAAIQELTYDCNIDWTHAIQWRHDVDGTKELLKKKLLMSAFDCGPTRYYDYRQKKTVSVNTETFIEMKKLAQATPEIGYVANWYRTDAPPHLERLESLILAFQYTDKSAGVEAIFPEVVKYLKDAGDIISGDSGDETGTYLAGSQCISPPLYLEDRSAREIIEREKCGIHKYHVATMGALGMSLPVSLAGAMAVSAAEILGGWAAVHAVDPAARYTGRMICNTLDMRTLAPSCSGPEVPLVNRGVKELFDEFLGGHCWVDPFFAPSAKTPGLKTVYENFHGSMATGQLATRPHMQYIGVGVLDNGGVGSPTQLMLDLEIRKSQFRLRHEVTVDEDELAFEEIQAAVEEDRGFLESPTTLNRFRELWHSDVFGPAEEEKAILDTCDAMWREKIQNDYSYEGLDPDKLKELRKVVERAKKEFT